MSAGMPSCSLNLESQLLSIMDVLVKAAVTEISQMFSENSATIRLHLSQSLKENEALRMRMKVMRSELFSLRLQTRTQRPPSRFSLKGNVPKPRTKPQVAQKTVEEVVSISLQSKEKTSSAASRLECADVILIKDEDDFGECEQVQGQDHFGNQSKQSGIATVNVEPAGSSCLTENNVELRIVSVHGRGEGPLQEESSLFNITQLQAFSSLSPDHSIPHDSIADFTLGSNDGPSIRGMQNNSVVVDTSAQVTSAALNPAIKTIFLEPDSHAGPPSHISQFPQLQNVFPQTVNKSIDCSFCGERFLSREDLIVHRASHTGESPVLCSFCGKSFVNKTTLGIHMRIHTGEKPYACTQCGKRFTQNGSLKIHLRTHSGEKPYTCNHCTASFNNPSNLRRHMSLHIPNGAL